MRSICSIIIMLIALRSTVVKAETNIRDGETIFKSRCASCHQMERVVVGPALKDVDKRRNEKWIVDFVHSSQTMIKKGDPEAVKIFNEMNQAIMPDHVDLTNDDIKNIIAYIKEASSKVEVKAKTHSYRPAEEKGNNRPLTFSHYRVFIFFIFLIMLIVWVLNVVINSYSVIKSFRNNIRDDHDRK
jgi:cytochrome c2